MNVHTMQRIDYWFGIPLCALLSVVNFLLKPFRGAKETSSSIRRSLCIELSEMGSAILAYPMMKKALESHPGLECHFLIFRRNCESVEALKILPLDHIHVIEDTDLVTFVISTLRTLVKLRRLGFDVSFDLELFSRCTAVLSFLIGATYKVGFHNYTEEGLYRGSFFSHPVWYNPHYHIAQNFMALFESLKTEQSEPPLVKLPIRKAELALPRLSFAKEAERASRIVREAVAEFSPEKRLVLFNPDPGLLQLRAWPVESYRALAERLLSEDESLVVGVIGLSRSSHYFDLLSKGSSRSHRYVNLCGAMETLHDLLGLFQISAALVTNDSGPAHLAPLVGLRSVVFFGPETPSRYAPLGDTTTNLYAGFACSPCFSAQNHRKSVCTNNRCLQAITLDEAYSAARMALSGAHEAASEGRTRT